MVQTRRYRLAQATIILFLAITCFDILSGLEHWPFGNYPMYSLLYPTRLSMLRLYGQTAAGEMPLRDDDQFPPFDQARLTMALERLCAREDRGHTLPAALSNLMQLYRKAHASAPPLRVLRLYRVTWNLHPGLNGSEAPDSRSLIAGTTE